MIRDRESLAMKQIISLDPGFKPQHHRTSSPLHCIHSDSIFSAKNRLAILSALRNSFRVANQLWTVQILHRESCPGLLIRPIYVMSRTHNRYRQHLGVQSAFERTMQSKGPLCGKNLNMRFIAASSRRFRLFCVCRRCNILFSLMTNAVQVM